MYKHTTFVFVLEYDDDDKEVDDKRWSWRKLPKGNSANTSKIAYCRICTNAKNCVCLEYDDDENDDDEDAEDDGEICAHISDWTKISFQELINYSLFCTH